MNETDMLFNKDKFCCICFCEEHLQDLFLSRYLECSLHDLVKMYLDVSIHDLLKTICINCTKSLIRTHNFLTQCKEASKMLRNYIFPLENTESSLTTKVLQEFNIKLYLKKYNLTELEGSIKSYVIASCDKNNAISGDEVTEDDNGNFELERKAKKSRLKKHYKNGDAGNSNDNAQKQINYKSKQIFDDELNNVQNNHNLIDTNLDFPNLIKEIQGNETTTKVESSNLNMTADTGYSDDDDLPLIIHRDRSLAITAQDDVTNELKEEKFNVKLDYDDYFKQENDYFDTSEDKFFESSNDKVELERFALPIKKSKGISKRQSGIKRVKSDTITCYICQLSYARKSQWRQHLKTEHPDIKNNEYVTCDICGKQLKAMCMKTHIKNVHQLKIPKNKFLCPICGKLYNANQRRRHTLLHDTPKPYQCEHCAFRCSQRGNLRRHQRRHTGEKPYLCTVCGHGASQKGTLLEHMKSHEVLSDPVSCVFCQLEFATNFEYRRHRRVHKNDIAGDKSQNGNGGQSKDSRSLERTGAIEGSAGIGGGVIMDASLVCPICKKQLMSESGFKCHVRAHKESGRYRCQHCSKSFTSKATLEYHIRIHTGEKPYRCTSCPKRFKQPGHLTAHMAIHANRREHRCTYCDQTFNIKFNLVEHLRIHTGDTIDCEFCGKKFRHNSNRRKHIRETHPGEVKQMKN